MARVLNYCFTTNNYTEQLFNEIKAVECKYMCVGKEVGESGTPHLQGVICFKTVKSLKQVSELIPHSHIEAIKGSVAQNIVYCSKGGDVIEIGERPMSQKRKGEVEKERWELALSAFKAGNFDQVPADIGIRYGKGLEHWANKSTKRVLSDTDEKHEWYYGPSGTGKSRKAREENPGAYLKMANKWWDGYNDEDVVILEDLDIKHEVLVHHLKIWGDRYPFPAEVKGTKIDIRPKKIIVTSNYHPKEIWTSSSDLEPILRRYKPLHFNTLFKKRSAAVDTVERQMLELEDTASSIRLSEEDLLKEYGV